MNIHVGSSHVWTGITVVAQLLAGCETSTAQQSGYKFEVVGRSAEAGAELTVTVRFDRADGSPVSGAKLFAPQPGPPRARKLIPLQPDGPGGYAYTSPDLHTGETLQLAAEVEPDSSLIWGTIDVPR